MTTRKLSPVHILGIVVIGGSCLAIVYGLLSGKAAEAGMRDVNAQVTADYLAQYEIAARNGSATDRCVAAGMVVHAMLQAKDEPGYAHWKAVEAEQCKPK